MGLQDIQKQMPLITSIPENPIIEEIKDIDINKLTPLKALEKLNDIIKILKNKKS